MAFHKSEGIFLKVFCGIFPYIDIALLGSRQFMTAVSVSEIRCCSYLGLPFHSCHRDAQKKNYCDGSDDSGIICLIQHDGIYTLRDITRSHYMK